MDCSTPGFPVLHRLLELAQTHVHRVGDAIQPSHPLLALCLWPSTSHSPNFVCPCPSSVLSLYPLQPIITILTVSEKILFCLLFALVVVQLLSCVWLYATPWTAVCQASLSFTISWSLLKLMSIELMMSSSHLILCHPLLLLPSVFPSIQTTLHATLRVCRFLKRQVRWSVIPICLRIFHSLLWSTQSKALA